MNEARAIIEQLGLAPHPEGGWYARTWRAPAAPGERAAGTAIYYLLQGDERSHWHRVDAAEIWLWHRGAPLELALSSDGHDSQAQVLGPDLAHGQQPQLVVPARCWQSAVPHGPFTLMSCVVTPGFEYSGFEMAPPLWRPQRPVG